MMDGFTIDQGNSLIKLALFDGTRLNSLDAFDSLEKAKPMISKWSFLPTIISSVSGNQNQIEDIVKQSNNKVLYTLDYNTNVPVTNRYASKETLGMDRLAAVCGAREIFSKSNCLVVDFGTCVTYDVLTNRGEYLGGAISPGLKMRFRAMNEFTGSLPLIDQIEKSTELIGSDTQSSMVSGVINGMRLEIEGFIEKHSLSFDQLKVVFTGGDSSFFESMVKGPIFAAPNLVVVGLNSILRYNEEAN